MLVLAQPNGRKPAVAGFMYNAVLAIVKLVLQMDWMVSAARAETVKLL